MQYTRFLRVSDKESVIVSPAITVHTLREKEEIKTMSVLTRLPISLVTRLPISQPKLTKWPRQGNILVKTVEMAVRKNEEVQNC